MYIFDQTKLSMKKIIIQMFLTSVLAHVFIISATAQEKKSRAVTGINQ
jgi:hypothetical protein